MPNFIHTFLWASFTEIFGLIKMLLVYDHVTLSEISSMQCDYDKLCKQYYTAIENLYIFFV